MSQRENRRIATLRDRLNRAATAQPKCDDHLDEQRALVAVISASRTDGSHGSKGDHSDPTAGTSLELDRITYKRRTILDLIATLELGVTLLEDAQRDALGHQARREPTDTDTEAKPRCIGDNTAAGATCWQVPAERRDHSTNQTVDDGRCLDCGRRIDERRRAKSEHERKRRLSSSSTEIPGRCTHRAE